MLYRSWTYLFSTSIKTSSYLPRNLLQLKVTIYMIKGTFMLFFASVCCCIHEFPLRILYLWFFAAILVFIINRVAATRFGSISFWIWYRTFLWIIGNFVFKSNDKCQLEYIHKKGQKEQDYWLICCTDFGMSL